MSIVSYARVGGPPDNWSALKVFDVVTGVELNKVIEVNALEGWVLRYAESFEVCSGAPPCPLCGVGEKGDHARAERVVGKFEIK